MLASPHIIILPSRNCRRSKKVLDYLTAQGISFIRIDLETPAGQKLAEKHHLRASPGILVDDDLVNPFDVLIQPGCRIDEAGLTRQLKLFPTPGDA